MEIRWLTAFLDLAEADAADAERFWRTECDDRERLTARHTADGARVVATFPRWTTLADPTGRLYCLTDHPLSPVTPSSEGSSPAARA